MDRATLLPYLQLVHCQSPCPWRTGMHSLGKENMHSLLEWIFQMHIYTLQTPWVSANSDPTRSVTESIAPLQLELSIQRCQRGNISLRLTAHNAQKRLSRQTSTFFLQVNPGKKPSACNLSSTRLNLPWLQQLNQPTGNNFS
ncbi:hypothetical protein O6H91_10G062500 [Diphasiastrum complanatum]|uniref:Uncharacterized protein n=1 Tax=Diphasiastrum complanatum TaxID=34168 RepID=A0ACC2CHR4_DIPCM|nr:hypothetical protein O6H91_10G062500 [Diphasiastrum complanatum]